MSVHNELTFFALVAVVALICGMVLTRLRQPAIVGYIVAGVVLGPTGLALVEDRDQVNVFAELGVLLLMFVIGMELSLRAFKTVLRVALLGALMQIGVGLGVMLLLAQVLGWSIELAVLFGFVVALSSTAVAIKMLEDIGELRSEIGRGAVGILIAQDLAVVPMMLVLNSMATEAGFEAVSIVPIAFAVGFLALFVWYLSRRHKISLPMSRWFTGDHDLTPLAALAFCFAAATVSGLLGLSAAYGAFLAGLLIGNSTDRRAMIRAARPIESVLLMVFFLSIGLLIDLDYIWQHLASVFVLLLVVTVGKTALNAGVLRLLGEPWPRAFLIGVVLGQVGEFSFVLVALGLGNGLIGTEDHRLAVSVIALSLMISPLWLNVARRLHNLAATSIDTVNELFMTLYPDETAAVQQTADSAARGAYRMAVAVQRHTRRLLARRGEARPTLAPKAAAPKAAADPPAGASGEADAEASAANDDGSEGESKAAKPRAAKPGNGGDA